MSKITESVQLHGMAHGILVILLSTYLAKNLTRTLL